MPAQRQHNAGQGPNAVRGGSLDRRAPVENSGDRYRGGVPRPEPEESEVARRPTRLTGASAVRLHLTLLAGLTICVGAFVIEVFRALGGNTLSWCYVFEWPILAGFAVYMWWNLYNGRSGHERRPPASGDLPDHHDEEYDEKLAAWNRYVREMDSSETVRPEPGT